MKVRTPENRVIEENLADLEIESDKIICCPDCDRNESDWVEYQKRKREHT